ncbi:hypothetical protein BDR03DRAFT_1017409 [Suillus americanus]|nr:hypothetical protein BDR03DRAFT_1017409 [Suillus americanus]
MSNSLILIFDTTTWQQTTILEGHTIYTVNAITLSGNNCLLASTSHDSTVHLWNLYTNLQVRPPFQHGSQVQYTALSADGRVLVTGCRDNNMYIWDIHVTLKQAGLKDLLLPTGTDIAQKDKLEHKASQGEPEIERTSCSSISDKSFLEFWGVDEVSPQFFEGMEAGDNSPDLYVLSPPQWVVFTLIPLQVHFSLILPHFSAAFDPISLKRPDFCNLKLIQCYICVCSWATSLHSSTTLHLKMMEQMNLSNPPHLQVQIYITNEETKPNSTAPLGSCPDAPTDLLFSLFCSQPCTSQEFELLQCPMYPHVVEVPAMRDREVLFVAEPLPQNHLYAQPNGTTTPGGRPVYSLPVQMLAHLILFLCCASPPCPDGNAHSTQQQQQGQSQGPVQAQALSLQTQPSVPLVSTSMGLTSENSHIPYFALKQTYSHLTTLLKVDLLV